MTTERDFDRLARAWLEQGPDEAPDRVVAAVLQAAETTSQVRRPIRWLPWRSITMTRLRMGAAIAVVLVVAVGGVYLLSRNNGVGPAMPTATPVVTPSAPPASPESLPTNLIGRWMGGPRTAVPGLTVASGTVLTVSKDGVALAAADQPNSPLLATIATPGSGGQFRLTSAASCPGGAGEYAYQLSAGDRHLHVEVVSDPCASRLAAIPGDYVKSECKIPANACLGDVAAGTYSSQLVAPRIKAGATWAPNFGAITYTVPDGWANSSDLASELHLTPSANYALETADGAAFGTWYEIGVWTQPAVNDPDVDCFTPLTTVPRTVDAFIAHLVASPAITATAPQDITVDGHAGKSIDIAIDPAWTGTCPGANGAANVLIDAGLAARWVFGPVGTDRVRVILLDLGSGDLVFISLEDGDGTKLDQLVTEAMPIVQSFRFE